MKHPSLYIVLTITLLLITQLSWSQTESYPIDTIDGKAFYRYTVERSIGLYRISVNFDVKQEEILQANPSLQKRGLRYGEDILIPVKETIQEKVTSLLDSIQPEQIVERIEQKAEQVLSRKHKSRIPEIKGDFLEKVADTIAQVDSLLSDTVITDSVVLDSTTIRLAMLLPLQTEAIKRDKNMDRFYDFYAGSLIAIYEAQAKGQMLEVFTYDIGRTTRELTQICQQPEIHTVDAIIGPAYSQQVTLAIDSTRNDSTWILIPFVSKVKEIEQHPYLLKFNPSDQVVADTVARYLAAKGDSINCVLVESKEGDVIPAGIAALRQALKQYKVPQTTISVHSILVDSLEEAVLPDVENIIIFNTEKYANLQAVMPHLLKACGQYRLTLFSQYSWQNEKIILPQLYTSVFAPEPVVSEEYKTLYRQYFNHELSSTRPRYDLLGYDLTSHLLQILMTKQTNDSTYLSETPVWEGTQANIHYQPVSEYGGWENHVIHIIHQ